MRTALDPETAQTLFGARAAARFALVRDVWPTAVGANVARHTEVVAFDGQTLRVRVGDQRWMRPLHRLQRTIMQRLARRLGSLAPQRLGFVVGRLSQPSAVSAVKPPRDAVKPLPSRNIAEAADVIEDDELRRLFLDAAARYLGRRSPR